MSYRGVNQSALDLIRDLKDEIEVLKRQVGSVKQNTIRLGDWVLEAVDDSRVRMTNLVTGEISYIGGDGSGGDTIINNISQNVVAEFPPFVCGGVIRGSFGNTIKTNVYIVPNDITINRIITTLAITTAENDGPAYRIYRNGVIVYTSSHILTNYVSDSVAIPFFKDDVVYMEIHDTGDGDSVGLTSMLREA